MDCLIGYLPVVDALGVSITVSGPGVLRQGAGDHGAGPSHGEATSCNTQPSDIRSRAGKPGGKETEGRKTREWVAERKGQAPQFPRMHCIIQKIVVFFFPFSLLPHPVYK